MASLGISQAGWLLDSTQEFLGGTIARASVVCNTQRLLSSVYLTDKLILPFRKPTMTIAMKRSIPKIPKIIRAGFAERRWTLNISLGSNGIHFILRPTTSSTILAKRKNIQKLGTVPPRLH